MITRETLDNGIRLATETMGHVRSVSIGVWLTRGSRHETEAQGGIAHFIEHMLFKGTTSRSAEQIAQEVDSIGGQLDAFTSKEYAGYYVKVLDEHLAIAFDLLSDLVTRPAFLAEDIEREKKVILEEIKMVEDTPDYLVHELFTQRFWQGHPLGRPIFGTPRDHRVVLAAGAARLLHRGVRRAQLHRDRRGQPRSRPAAVPVGGRVRGVAAGGSRVQQGAAHGIAGLLTRHKELEQSHLCVGASLPAGARRAFHRYVLNTILGGHEFAAVPEHPGEAGAGLLGVQRPQHVPGCRPRQHLRGLRQRERQRGARPGRRRDEGDDDGVVPDAELRRAKDHLKGNLMLSLESTSSRMTHLARQDLYFDRFYTLDETLDSIEAVSGEDVLRVARDLFSDGALAATVLGGGTVAAIDGGAPS